MEGRSDVNTVHSGIKLSSIISVLQNRWKVLEKLARNDQKLKSVYQTIKQDIQTLEEELAEHQTKVKGYERKSVKDLRKYLRFYKVCLRCS
jgi:ribosome-binding ATPase YchF (GTP1/OBG family)